METAALGTFLKEVTLLKFIRFDRAIAAKENCALSTNEKTGLSNFS